ncbi:hypothetical protein [Streptomyces sp. NPDC006739]|uniref:hypothetical protein n=1 Tax=Streptomyces sp. NPDC006739 TaxID=3364763 RepID=UPI0036C66E52
MKGYTGTQAMLGSAWISTFYPEVRTVFDEGLRDKNERAEFFAQRRTRHGLAEPTLDFTPSFLWYFDEHGSVDTALALGVLVHADHTGCGGDGVRRRGDQPQQGCSG